MDDKNKTMTVFIYVFAVPLLIAHIYQFLREERILPVRVSYWRLRSRSLVTR